jgi:hypothetical protein
MITEHYYTSLGRQRAVFFRPEERVKFSLDLKDGDDANIEITYDPESSVQRRTAKWELYEGGLGGGIEGATALRVNVLRVDAWVKLSVERVKHERPIA